MKNTLSGIGFILFAILCLKMCEMGIYPGGFDMFYLTGIFGIAGIVIVIIEFFSEEKR